jgi:biofilm PGA synthesis N-glycosyltransferase PgaC
MLFFLFWASVFFVVYTYLGYPLLIALAARFIRNHAPALVSDLPVTLLITAYNEENVIGKKIENSLSLDYPADKLQIIVAADGSTDRTPEIVKQFKERGVVLAFTPQRDGKMAAINRAIPLAHGDIIVFSDANNMYETDAIRKLVAPFSDAKVGATTGAKLIIQDGGNLSGAEGIYWKYESWIKKNETALGTCTSSVGEILAVRRALYNPPPNNIINDDYYMVLDLIRRGFQIHYVPEARSLEYISATTRDEMVRRSRMNAGKYQAISLSFNLLPFNKPLVIWQIISHKYCRAFLPFGFIGALLANILIVLFQSNSPSSFFYWVLLLLQIAFYGAAVVGNRVKFQGFLGKIFYLPTYLVNSNVAILRGFYGYMTKKQTNIWERVRRDNI